VAKLCEFGRKGIKKAPEIWRFLQFRKVVNNEFEIIFINLKSVVYVC